MEKSYKKLILSLNELIEVDSDLDQIEKNSLFGADISVKTQASGPDYYKWKTLNLFYNGKCEDINIGNYIFSCIVNVDHYSHFCKGERSTMFIKVKEEKNDTIYSFKQNTILNQSDLVNVVFAMIIISVCKNIKESEEIWNLLSDRKNYSNIEQCISEIRVLRDKGLDIISNYPFMKNLFISKIQERVLWVIKRIELESKIE